MSRSPTDEIVIQTEGLTRSYNIYKKDAGVRQSLLGFWKRKYETKTAVHPTDLKIARGEVVGLVGANGAGKTTLLKMFSGLIFPSSGTVKVLGHIPHERDHRMLRRISVLLGQKNQLWWDISPADSYQLLARIYDVSPQIAANRVQRLAQWLDCEGQLTTQLRRLSLGERMKMEVIGSLLHEPDVLFLDEPTIGLDVMAQTAIRKFLAQYVIEKKPTVILTSHYMDDIARLATRLLLISHGQIVYDGTVGGFVEKSEPEHKLVVSFEEPTTQDLAFSGVPTLRAGALEFQAEVPANQMAGLVTLIASRTKIKELRIEEGNFEDVIRKFLEKESRLFSTRRDLPT